MSGQKQDRDKGALKRAQEQAEKILTPPDDGPQADDPIERLGKRIARILSIIGAIALAIYLWQTYFTR